MKITSFKFGYDNWHLEKTVFDNFNLLVGVSGVGKTRILKALELVCDVATDSDYKLNGVKWQISFEHAAHEYEWTLKSAKVKFSKQPAQSSIFDEKIVMKHKEVPLVERSENAFLLNGNPMPKLKKTESAITLLSEEPTIAPIYEAFKKIIFSQTRQREYFYPLSPEDLIVEMSLEQFKEDSVQQASVVKAYQLAKFYPEAFSQLKMDFTEIFTSVEDIKVSLVQKKEKEGYEEGYEEGSELSFNIKENNEWVSQSRMSSGMFRSLVHLVDISLAPQGSVILIDEFENSLGINCMPELTDFVMSKAPFMPFSHHPYIISKIPYKTWKIVRRKGGCVSVINATDIPQLQTGSRLNKFVQLANLPEYEDGIL
ncbi:hypothetical protein PN36_00170 [Candidatus Thiomargarita nelsonii]|uniref:Uncharacterized protein n=1 Tax=Candidatus Thiomargarita nelsonii TaxID=1003181 RepID=A0A0A6PE60_9GAMM|nr:hypothetical protein PN36_00170 [Candidatus Thiomargarita nelsonii]